MRLINDSATARAAVFGEDARLWCFGEGDVADRVDAGEVCFERPLMYGHPAVFCHAAGFDYFGCAVSGDAEEEVVGEFGVVVEHGDAACWVERSYAAVGDVGDAALGEGGEQSFGGVWRWRDGIGPGHHHRDLALAADAFLREVIVQEQSAFAGCGRALVRCGRDADDGSAFCEGWEEVAHLLGAGDGVEFVACFGEAGGGVHVVVCTEGDDEVVGVVGACVGGDAFCCGIDGGDCLLQEADAGLDEVAVGQADCVELGVAEHNVELGEAEYEGIALVDQGHVDLIGHCFGQSGA